MSSTDPTDDLSQAIQQSAQNVLLSDDCANQCRSAIEDQSGDTDQIMLSIQDRLHIDSSSSEISENPGLSTPPDVVLAKKPAPQLMSDESSSNDEIGNRRKVAFGDLPYINDDLLLYDLDQNDHISENEDSADEIDVYTGLEYYDMNQIVLDQLLQSLPCLKDQQWILSNCIDTWLLLVWRMLDAPQACYIPNFFITAGKAADQIEKTEIQNFRDLYLHLPPSGQPCPLIPIIYVMNTGGNHFFTVIVVPSKAVTFVIGRRADRLQQSVCDHNSWNTWGGDMMYASICRYMGWDTIDLGNTRVYSVDWKQNGYDCGPIACQVAQYVMQHGPNIDTTAFWKQPTFPCCHVLRLKMAEAIHLAVIRGRNAFITARTQYRVQLIRKFGDDGLQVQEAMHTTLGEALAQNPAAELSSVTRNLQDAISKCQQCHSQREEVRHIQERRSHPIPIRSQGLKETAHQRQADVLRSTISVLGYVDGDPTTCTELEPEIQRHDTLVENGQGFENPPDSPQAPQRQSTFRALEFRQATIGRFPRPKAIDIPKRKHLRGLRHPFDRDFDQYEGGPTLTELEPIVDAVMQFQPSLVYLCNRMTITPWTLFKDYGYRILPTFAQMFHLDQPILVKDHLCSTGLSNPPNSLAETHPPPKQGRHGQHIVTHDLRVVGLGELLDIADQEGSDGILLTGKTKEGQYISLDLLRDRELVDDVQVASDIDSVVWVTRRPLFKAPIGIYTAPVIRDRAPIWKQNHVKVELLFPQSEDDQMGLGGRYEWQTNMWSLSTLPHLLFGVLNQVTSAVELLLFFPRMAHKDPYRGFWVNRIPKDIQDFFWDHVLLPLLSEVVPPTRKPYLPGDRRHSTFKQGRGRHQSKSSTITVTSEGLVDLIQRMKDKIEKGGDTLAKYGSFFFVLQIKGCKALAHSDVSDWASNFNLACVRFQQSFPALDWKYMNDRQYGELVFDVGITIHPISSKPLVGLFRLDSLEASFGAAGFNSGIMHTLNTLGMFGGIQAEAPTARRLETHVSFRSAYNLAYEATRQRDNQRNIFDEKHVYSRDPQFHQEVESVRDIYTRMAAKTTYGVRDEFRIGGAAFNPARDALPSLILRFVESEPVAWLPSELWFRFLDRRLGILVDAHENTWRKQPPNYGVTSGLLAFLMQSVIFTPPRVNWYVKDSLAALNFKANCERFGMFFLDVEDPTMPWLLDGLIEIDEPSVLRELKVPMLRPRPAQLERMDDDDIEEFPLGRTPSWAEITHSLASNPTILIPRLPEGLPDALALYSNPDPHSMDYEAGKLFILFTRHLWTILHPLWRSEPETPIQPQTVAEALQCWSVDFAMRHIKAVSFKPTNAQSLHGVGRKALPFDAKADMYFPGVATVLVKNWRHLTKEPGYIWAYRKIIRLETESNRDSLKECLGNLLAHCQCLPDSAQSGTVGHIWKPGNHMIIMITNRNFYRIQDIGRSNGNRTGYSSRSAPAHRSARAAAVAMLEQEGHAREVANRAYRQHQKSGQRSGPAKNRRVPPQRKKSQTTLPGKRVDIGQTSSSGTENTEDGGGEGDGDVDDSATENTENESGAEGDGDDDDSADIPTEDLGLRFRV